MREFLEQTKAIVDELAGIGCPIKPNEYVDAILKGFPQDYAPMISVIESKFEMPPISEVEALLLAHEYRVTRFQKKVLPSINYTQSYTADPRLLVRTNNFRGSCGRNTTERGGRHCGGRGRGRFANFQCQIYLKYGHTTNVCFYRGDSAYQPHESLTLFDPTTNQPLQLSISQSNSNFKLNTWINPATSQNRTTPLLDVPSALLTNSVVQENGNSTWIPNSGASFHVTGNSQNIQQLNHFERPDHIYIGNGEGLQVFGSGSSCLQNSKFPLYLNNLLHVPSITKNLLSVVKFALDNNVFFEFYPYHCNVKSQATNEVILRDIVGADGLYSFPDFKISSQPSSVLSKKSQINTVSVSANNSESFVVSSSKPSNLWHARLGHPNDHVLRLVLTQCNIHSINKTIDFCNSCGVGKSNRLSSSLSNTVYNSPLELIYSDLWGPSHVPSNEGYLYYVSFVDAFSRFTWLYPIKLKSEAITVFQSFKTMVELFSSKIKSIQTD